jgi:hypothetical protein
VACGANFTAVLVTERKGESKIDAYNVKPDLSPPTAHMPMDSGASDSTSAFRAKSSLTAAQRKFALLFISAAVVCWAIVYKLTTAEAEL